jgi:hypothetical protein
MATVPLDNAAVPQRKRMAADLPVTGKKLPPAPPRRTPKTPA